MGTPKPSVDAEKQLARFISKFGPGHQALIRSVRRALRRRLPAANELVWDNYNFFVIGYSSTERPSDSVVSLAAGANGVGLSFYQRRPSRPEGILLGEASRTASRVSIPPECWPAPKSRRYRRGRGPEDALPEGRGRLIIQSVLAKRPRK
jgi:hypothetical protein